jgi:hypothetical protein
MRYIMTHALRGPSIFQHTCRSNITFGLTGTADNAHRKHHSTTAASSKVEISLQGQQIEQLISAMIFDSTDQPSNFKPWAQYPEYPLGA